MLNKKMLAVAVAAAMTSSFASAAPLGQAYVDLDGSDDVTPRTWVKYAKELAWGESTVIVDNTSGTPSHLKSDIGFTISEGTSKYIRIDLDNGAKFAVDPFLTWNTLVDELAGQDQTKAEQHIRAYGANPALVDPGYPATSNTNNWPLPQPQSVIAAGGEGESFVIFEVTAFERDPNINEDIPGFLSFIVNTPSYELPVGSVTTATHVLYEDAVDAQRGDTTESLFIAGAPIAEFVDATTPDYTIPNDAYASVDSEYTVFVHAGSTYADHDELDFYDYAQGVTSADNDGGAYLANPLPMDTASNWTGVAASSTTASLGLVDTEMLVATPVVVQDLDGGLFTVVDVIGTDPDLRFYGDFSWGDWELRLDSNPNDNIDVCNDTTDIKYPDSVQSTSTMLVFDELEITQAELEMTENWALCVEAPAFTSDVDDNFLAGSEDPWTANRIMESDYTTTLTWEMPTMSGVYDWVDTDGAGIVPLSDDMGSILYDTITVDVPFLSIFGTYNQRFTLVNNGPTPATYTFMFTPEAGIGVNPGAAATGVIPAGESIVVRADEIVASFTGGKTRTAAQIHIGAEDEDVSVAVQIVNTASGTIDTSVLNANSIRGTKTNMLP